MPITAEQMSHAEMKKIADNPQYRCGECKGGLVLAWGGGYGIEGYILKCANNIEHSTISKYDRKWEEFMNEQRIEAGKDSTALMAMDKEHMLARINQAKFPQELKPEEKNILAIACITYGFDPIMRELSIYQGNPYVSIDGRYRKAQETGKLDGVETRPATKEEREAWQIPEGDFFFRAEVYMKGSNRPFVGWGRVRKVETITAPNKTAFRPIETNPQRMAEKRAEAQALRKAFHIPLPSAEYIGSEDEEPPTIVDVSAGEIIKGEVVSQEPPPEAVESKSAPPEDESSGNGQKRDPESIKTITGLQKALFDDFGLQPKQQLAELNIESWPDLDLNRVSLAEAYAQIAAARS